MPQLDHFSFFSQVFWVLFFFTTFYFLNVRQTLPAVASVLKVRRRILQKSQNTFGSLNSDKSASISDSNTEFFALAKVFASVSLTGRASSQNLLNSQIVKDCFDTEFKKVAPQSLVFNIFSRFVRKSS